MDIGRAVAGTNTNGRLAGGVGGANHGRATGGQDHADLRCAHQLLTACHGGQAQAADGACRCAGGDSCLFHNSCRPEGTFQRFGVWGENNGVAGFQGNEGFIANGGGGVGAGDDGSDHTHGNTHFPQLPVGMAIQNAHGFHVPDGIQNRFRCEDIFCCFVGNVAEAGFPDGHFRQFLRMVLECGGNSLGDGIKLGLAHGAQLGLGFLCLTAKQASLLPRR